MATRRALKPEFMGREGEASYEYDDPSMFDRSRDTNYVQDDLAPQWGTGGEASEEYDDPSMFSRDSRTPRLDDVDWVENPIYPPIDKPIDREFIGRDNSAPINDLIGPQFIGRDDASAPITDLIGPQFVGRDEASQEADDPSMFGGDPAYRRLNLLWRLLSMGAGR